MLDAQRAIFVEQLEQPVYVGMLAWIGAGIGDVFGVQLDPLPRGFRGDGAIELRQVVVDGERALLSRLVLYCRHHLIAIEQL